MLKATTIHLDEELYEQLRLYVFARKMFDPQLSNSKIVATALREYFDRHGQP